jgi:hypothetical protein
MDREELRQFCTRHGPPEALTVAELPSPSPAREQVVIEVHGVGQRPSEQPGQCIIAQTSIQVCGTCCSSFQTIAP